MKVFVYFCHESRVTRHSRAKIDCILVLSFFVCESSFMCQNQAREEISLTKVCTTGSPKLPVALVLLGLGLSSSGLRYVHTLVLFSLNKTLQFSRVHWQRKGIQSESNAEATTKSYPRPRGHWWRRQWRWYYWSWYWLIFANVAQFYNDLSLR